MSLIEMLSIYVGASLGKFLLKSYLEEPSVAVGAPLIDIAKKKIEGYRDRKTAERQFEQIGESIAEKLLPIFERETPSELLHVEAVVKELGETLQGRISANFFVSRDLDREELSAAFRQEHPLPKGFSKAETELYLRALDLAVRYLVDITPELPHFVATNAAASLQRLTGIAAAIDDLAERFDRLERGVAREEDEKSRSYELDYRGAILRRLDYLELFGADLRPESRRHQLSVAYVSLQMQSAGNDDDDEATILPIETVLSRLGAQAADPGRLIIRGEAGSGKSTLFRWVALRAAGLEHDRFRIDLDRSRLPRNLPAELVKEHLHAEAIVEPYEDWVTDSWRQRIPFLIRLRDCQGGKLPSPEDFPELIAREIGKPPRSWVIQVLKAQRCLVLLDGIDEIPNLHRDTALREIDALVTAYPGNLFLVSTRPEAVPDGWLAGLGFQEARVNPLSSIDRDRFIKKWHDAVAQELERSGRSVEDLGNLADDLKSALAENPPMARLATNPLLCAMICALHRDRGQKLPETQAKLCEALCEMLLHRRERESGLDLSEFPKPYIDLTYEQKRAMVQKVAQFMVLEGSSTIGAETAEKKIGEVLRIVPGQHVEDAAIVCKTMVERSGILREALPGRLDFIHNTFKEYMAADFFAEAEHVQLLVDRALDSTWQRILLFAVATPKAGFASEVIRGLLKKQGHSQRTCQMTALRCRAVASFMDPEIEKEIEDLAQKMFPPQTMSDAESLAAGGDAVVRFLYRKDMKTATAACCVRCLRLIGTRKALEILEGYRSDRRITVLAELAQVLEPLTFPVARERLLLTGTIHDSLRPQVSDISLISSPSNLKELYLYGTRISDVSPLSSLSNLRELYLYSTQVSDVSPLSELNKLRELYLYDTQISDVSPLSGLNSLQILYLHNTHVSDASPLSSLSSLQRLSLAGTQVSDVLPLSSLNNLQMLSLSNTQVSDISPLSGLSNLQRLSLDSTQVSDVSQLSSLNSLRELSLSSTQVSDVSPLSNLSSLQKLSLDNTQVSDVSPLSSLNSLQIFGDPRKK